MKSILLSLFLILSVFKVNAFGKSTLPETKHLLVLSIGHSSEWAAPVKVPVSVSNGAIVRVSDQGKKLKITAKKLGSAIIQAGAERLEVSVLSEAQEQLYTRLRQLLADRRGLELDVDDRQIVIRGRLLRWDDWLDLAMAAKGSSAPFFFEARVEADLSGHAQDYFKRLLRDAHLPELAIQLETRAEVSIPLEPADLKAHVEHVLQAYGFRVDQSSEALSLEPLVRVKLIVAEFKKSVLRTIGISWPEKIGAQLWPTFNLPSDASLGIDINALENNGMGRVLASPTLLCRSGKEASFLAGGEIPIRIINYKLHDIVWKQYGVRLNIRPKADFSGRMSIGLETEVSTLDMANAIDGIPGLFTNRIETHFDLASSRTIVLSGLIKNESSKSNQGLPGLSHLPILGPLFGSHDFRDNRTELVVFVTPELARPGEEETL